MIALCALLPAAAAAEEPRRIGVVVTTAVNVTDAEADAIASELGAALGRELPVDVIAGADTRRRLPAEGLPEECVADSACRHDLGRRLDAAELLMLVIVRIGDRLQIDPTWANVVSGNVTSRPAVVVEAGQDRAKVFAEAAPKLLPHIQKEAGPPRTEIIVVPPGGGGDGGRHMTTGAWIASGVAAAALIGGTVFALSAANKHDALEGKDCSPAAPCDPAEVDSLERHALAADVLFGVGIASGVTALVLYLRSDDGGRREPAAAAPATVGLRAGPGEVGLAIGGSF